MLLMAGPVRKNRDRQRDFGCEDLHRSRPARGEPAGGPVHGGMGITREIDIGRYLKRGLVIRASFGSDEDHFCRYEAQMTEDANGRH